MSFEPVRSFRAFRCRVLFRARSRKREEGLSLCEVTFSIALVALGVGALVNGYMRCVSFVDNSNHVLAAQCQALERMEQVRAAKWDPNADPPIDQVVSSNFPPLAKVMDIPSDQYKYYATNYTSVTLVQTNPPLKQVRVDCVWEWGVRSYTNTIVTYRGPDQ